MKVLFLITELTGYLVNCLTILNRDPKVQIKIIKSIYNKDAPYVFPQLLDLDIEDLSDVENELLSKCKEFSPDLIYIPGWSNFKYLKIAYTFRSQIPIVAGLDTQWKNNFRQKVGLIPLRMILKYSVSHMWVAGVRQYYYARKLGYADSKIIFQLYSGNVEKFSSIANNKSISSSKVLLFVGRLVERKGVEALYRAFLSIPKEQRQQWKLRFIGEGSLKNKLKPTEEIEVRGFVQPDFLPNIAAEGTAFCLPSYDEPWGVTIHEFAAAGLPIITSKAVGASSEFVLNGYNGFLVEPKEESIREGLIKLLNLTDGQLLEMGNRSAELAKRISPSFWAANLLSILK